MAGETRILRHNPDQVRIVKTGVGGDEPDPADLRVPGQMVQKPGKGFSLFPVAPGVYVLAEENDLFESAARSAVRPPRRWIAKGRYFSRPRVKGTMQ